ncbi:MAG TPA: excinuclease ABC subunit UvrB [Candidatus Kapabacteria bacterium]|jgi:excinuclease ABC subunit B|nr:excinuclease ABC subunit UvrB [Candidatus Kapabacteria bacterium]HOV92919.1 excinuclease ABC subunit UvrB [Candidatus Kapabacteria bacterium]
MKKFKLYSNYEPAGDQPKAIKELVEGINRKDKYQVLLGVTGSGKTFTISNVIEQVQKPTLVLSPNKTLAAQLYSEFRQFFPENAVEYFISYYDYYQPEAYIPTTDTYIEKDFSINDEIDRLRLRATSALVEGRRDVIVVASVSSIYSIGNKDEFKKFLTHIYVGMRFPRQKFLFRLTESHYSRNDYDFQRGTFRVRGDIIDIVPSYENDTGIRIEFFGDTIDRISSFNIVTGKIEESFDDYTIYPAKLFVTSQEYLDRAMANIQDELYLRVNQLHEEGKLLEAQRLEQRTMFDLEMMREVGYCSGIENYSMHLSGRQFGERPQCLFDYFPEDYLLVVDESHISIPQIRGMYLGDRSRKQTLVDFGFRLPSALENRPLKFDEFESLINQVIFVSATPGFYELEKSEGVVVEQLIRPTGLLDPVVEVRPIRNQIDDLIEEIRKRAEKHQRVLVTTLTKRMAEDLADYLQNLGIRVAYIHSDFTALERVDIIRDLRLGETDVLVGVNLLREGLDLPEVSLVAVLDADKEGFLRDERSLMQISGRTARNAEGKVILYADRLTGSIQKVVAETTRRRELQMQYNKEHNINPETIYKSIEDILNATSVADIHKNVVSQREKSEKARVKIKDPISEHLSKKHKQDLIDELFAEMKKAAKELDFERAAELRDEIQSLQEKESVS